MSGRAALQHSIKRTAVRTAQKHLSVRRGTVLARNPVRVQLHSYSEVLSEDNELTLSSWMQFYHDVVGLRQDDMVLVQQEEADFVLLDVVPLADDVVQKLKGAEPPAPNTVQGVGLGPGFDVWMLMGQSETGAGNAATPDTVHYDDPDPRVRQYGDPTSGVGGSFGDTISAAIEPLSNPWPTGLGLSPMTEFMRSYMRWVTSNRAALIVPTGVGGTHLVSSSAPTWESTVRGSLLDHAISQGKAALAAAGDNARIAGCVWVQGQADDGASLSAYHAQLQALIAYLRGVNGFNIPTLPFVIAQMDPDWIPNHTNFGSQVGAAYVDAAQMDIPKYVDYCGYTDSPAGMSIETINPTHVNAVGQRIRGRSLFPAFLRALSNTSSVALGVPGAITLTQVGTSLNIGWGRSLGKLTGYVVQIRQGTGAWTTVTASDNPHADLRNSIVATGLVLGSSYSARVAALGSGTQSGWSSATVTLDLVPSEVTGLTAPTPTSTTISLSWSAATGGPDISYLIEYKLSSSGTWLTAASGVTALSYALAVLAPSTSYDVRVTAQDAAGSGAPSATLTRTTGALLGPFDVVGAAPMMDFAWSVTRRLIVGYTGSLIRVRRGSDNAEMDVGMVAGALDTATMLTWSGSASVFITTIYSQFGSSHADLIQPTQSKQPELVHLGALHTVTAGLGVRPCAVFDGVNDIMYASHGGSNVSGIFAQTQSGGVGWGMVAGALDSSVVGVIVSEGKSGAVNPRLWFLGNGGTANQRDRVLLVNDAGTTIVSNTGGTVITGAALHLFTTTDPGSSLIHYVDNVLNGGTFAYTPSGSFTPDTFAIGGTIGTADANWLAMSFCEFCSWQGVFSTADRNVLHANEQAFYATP